MSETTGSLGAALGRGPVMADGGLSTMLGELGAAPSTAGLVGALWTGEVLADRPSVVEAAHVRMFEAGARVVLAAGYQVSEMSAVAAGRSADEGDTLLVEATRRAVSARDHAMVSRPEPSWVAASIGPYGAVLADGSEYRGRYGIDREELAEFHRRRMSVWVDAQRDRSTAADVWWCETIPDGAEIAVLAGALTGAVGELVERGLAVPEVIVTMTVVSDGRCPTGEPISEAMAPLLDGGAPSPIAVGVNCCDPDDVAAALDRLSTVTSLPLVAKPNLGSGWSPRHLRRWLEGGARLVGGCCGTGTAELADLAGQLDEPGALVWSHDH